MDTADDDDDNDNENDDASPMHSKPVDILPGLSVLCPSSLSLSLCIHLGGNCITSFSVLSDKRHILTKDRRNKVALWDVFSVSVTVHCELFMCVLIMIGHQSEGP